MNNVVQGQRSLAVIKWLRFFMFMMFAMTTDSVGVIIPEVNQRVPSQHDGRGRVSLCHHGRNRVRGHFPWLPRG
jgi:fucose permease